MVEGVIIFEIIRLTDEQFRKVKKTLPQCSLYNKGNCIIHDGLTPYEPGKCPQTETHSLICKYYINAVLPANKELEREILDNSGDFEISSVLFHKRCCLCNTPFDSESRNTRFCPACAEKQRKLRAKERKRNQRDHKTNVTLIDNPYQEKDTA